MDQIAPKILGNVDASDAAPTLRQILMAVDSTTILAVTDANGVILHVNDLFCQISKYSREELIGKTHSIVKSGHHPKSFFVEMWRTIAKGRTWHGEIKNKAKDGSHYWVETSIVPLLGDDDKPYRYAAIRKDITDKKLLLEQVEEERAKSLNSEKMAALGEMAAGIAHEVGNPLGAMRGRIEMLKMKIEAGHSDLTDVMKTCETVMGLIDRTSKIIRGLKSYARDASNDPKEEIDVFQMVDDILDFSESRIKKGGIQLSKEFGEKRFRAWCREAEIGQVLVNLINNACDALQDQDERKVTVRARVEGEDAVIEIEDSGAGIPYETRIKIFEPFFTTKAVGSGTGLGLSIARKILDQHGGTLRLKEDGPTCFELRWPVQS